MVATVDDSEATKTSITDKLSAKYIQTDHTVFADAIMQSKQLRAEASSVICKDDDISYTVASFYAVSQFVYYRINTLIASTRCICDSTVCIDYSYIACILSVRLAGSDFARIPR